MPLPADEVDRCVWGVHAATIANDPSYSPLPVFSLHCFTPNNVKVKSRLRQTTSMNSSTKGSWVSNSNRKYVSFL